MSHIISQQCLQTVSCNPATFRILDINHPSDLNVSERIVGVFPWWRFLMIHHDHQYDYKCSLCGCYSDSLWTVKRSQSTTNATHMGAGRICKLHIDHNYKGVVISHTKMSPTTSTTFLPPPPFLLFPPTPSLLPATSNIKGWGRGPPARYWIPLPHDIAVLKHMCLNIHV